MITLRTKGGRRMAPTKAKRRAGAKGRVSAEEAVAGALRRLQVTIPPQGEPPAVAIIESLWRDALRGNVAAMIRCEKIFRRTIEREEQGRQKK